MAESQRHAELPERMEMEAEAFQASLIQMAESQRPAELPGRMEMEAEAFQASLIQMAKSQRHAELPERMEIDAEAFQAIWESIDEQEPDEEQQSDTGFAGMQEIERLLEMPAVATFEEFIDVVTPADRRQLCRSNRASLAAVLLTR